VFEAVRAAHPPRLYVAADGPRDGRNGESELCAEARRIAMEVDWPCQVKTLFRSTNLGCRIGVSSAIDWFFAHEEEGILLEDDCLPSLDFFHFCGELLDRFRDVPRVMAICGSSYAQAPARYHASYYFSYYADIWGWATWRRAWRHYDRDMAGWPEFERNGRLEERASGKTWRVAYWKACFDETYERRVDTWDYQWMYTVMEQEGLACYPTRNLVSNLGFIRDATHTVVTDPNQKKDPRACLPHQKLGFPLVHVEDIGRSARLERQMEMLRLDLAPPSFFHQGLRPKMSALGRRLLGDTAWSELGRLLLRR
jgi:hypothetical protein